MSCTGDCCVAFPIGATLDHCRSGGYRAGIPQVMDGDLLGFMLRELTTEQAIERRERFGVTQPIDPGVTYYRCVYWDEDTRRCGAYENRPAYMCGEYPYPPTPGRCDRLGRPEGIAGVCEHGCDCQGSPLLWEGDN
jgi:Fe-S-cluster containining protein